MTDNIDEVVKIWKDYLDKLTDWQKLVKDIQPKATGCGSLYDIADPINRPGESLAIADMRNLRFTWPHYHTGGEVEIYIVISGTGNVVVGGTISKLEKGLVIVTKPDVAHYTLPENDLVLAVINTPPFNPSNSVDLNQTDFKVGYDHDQFQRLSKYYPDDKS